MGIEFMPVQRASVTPNEARFASVGGSVPTAEAAFFTSEYVDPFADTSPTQLFGVAPQFQGINPFSIIRRF